MLSLVFKFNVSAFDRGVLGFGNLIGLTKWLAARKRPRINEGERDKRRRGKVM
jgi:hypothetical protein